jgi:hypothetical protein
MGEGAALQASAGGLVAVVHALVDGGDAHACADALGGQRVLAAIDVHRHTST